MEESWGSALWDQREVFETYSQNGIEFLEKFATFMKERIRIEQDYAKSLHRLFKNYQFKKKDDTTFTHQGTFKIFIEENDKFASQRELMADEMQNGILKVLNEMTSTAKNERRKALHKLTEYKEQINMTYKSLQGTKRKYYQAYDEANTALSHYENASHGLDYTKAQVLRFQKASQEKGMTAEKARDEYKLSLDDYNAKQMLYYEVDTMNVINKEIQSRAETRMASYSTLLQLYAELQKQNQTQASKSLQGIVDAAKSCEPAKDSLTLIQRHKTGRLHPGDEPFEDFSKIAERRFSNGKHQPKSNKYSIKRKSFSEINDYSDLPPRERHEKLTGIIATLKTELTELEKENRNNKNNDEIKKVKHLMNQYQAFLPLIENEHDHYSDEEDGDFPPIPTTTGGNVPIFQPPSTAAPPPPPPPPPFVETIDAVLTCQVLFDFDGEHEDGMMSIRKGETLVLIEEDDGSGWTKAMKQDQTDVGFVPSSYINIILSV